MAAARGRRLERGAPVNVTTYQVTESRHLAGADPGILSSAADAHPTLWIDVQDPESARLAELLTPLSLHPLIPESCIDSTPRSRVAAYQNAMLIELPTLRTWDDDAPSALSIVVWRAGVVTVHHGDLTAVSALAADLGEAMHLHNASPSAIVYHVLDRLIDENLGFALQARRAVGRLESAIDADTDSEILEDILTVKQALAQLGSIMEDQLSSCSALSTIEAEAFSTEGLREYFHDVTSHLEHALRSVERQEERTTSLHQHYILRLQERANNRLRLLTILSAVFMPALLIAGIYGMNFRHMPELSWRYSYPITLGAMGLLAGTALWFFYRRGWFK